METSPARISPGDSTWDEVVGQDTLVPMLGGGQRRYVNLDNAASTPALRFVQHKVDEFMEWYSSVHRGMGFKSRVSTFAYEEARRTVADFLGADLVGRTVVFVRNTTEAINQLARRLPARDGVVLSTLMEHHSNMLPWRPLGPVEYVGATADGTLDLGDLEEKLRRWRGKTRLVTLSGASNVTGYVNDVHRVARLSHSFGVPVLVDAAQLAPHRPIDMRPLHDPGAIDFLALSGHKLYAPYGAGALVGPRRFFEEGWPHLAGGGAIALVTLDDVLWAEPPEREEAGSPNVVGAVALAAALVRLKQIGMVNVALREAELTAYALRRLSTVPGIRIYGSADPGRVQDRLGVITFNLEGLPHSLVAAVLSWEYGVGVRNGCFCAQPYLYQLMGVGTERVQALRGELEAGDWGDMPGAVRISFGLYNQEEDVDTLADALHFIARGQYRGRYQMDPSDGAHYPVDGAPNVGQAFRLAEPRAAGGYAPGPERIPALQRIFMRLGGARR